MFFGGTSLFGTLTEPDIRFELSICVNDIVGRVLVEALRLAATAVVPGTPLDIQRTPCSGGEKLGLWFPSAPPAGRLPALLLSKRQPGENYLVGVSLNGIRYAANAIWADPRTPKRIPLPDPFPAARLRFFEIALVPPNRIVTRINGFVPIAILPDVNFTVTFTGTLFLDRAGQLMCRAEPSQIDVRNALLRGLLLDRIANVFANAFLGSTLDRLAGAGCGILARLVPSGVTIPGCGRINFRFTRLEVTPNGVILGSSEPLNPCLNALRVMEEPFRAPR
jgi:hypothetical protein